MNMKNLILRVGMTAVLAAGLLIALAAGPSPAAGADSASGALIYTVPLAQSGVSLSGVSSSHQEYFQLPDYWSVQEVRVRLEYRLSSIAATDFSSVTLSVNGTKFYSFRPSGVDGSKQELMVAVPVELLVKGSNLLRIEGLLRETANDRACQNIEAADKWLELDGDSRVEVSYTRLPLDGSIRDYYSRLAGMDVVQSGLSLVAVPEGTEAAEWEAAVYALSGLAAANPVTDRTIPLLPYGEGEVQGKEAVLLIGLYDRLPDEVKAAIGETELPDLERQAFIQLVNSEGGPLLVVASRNPELLITAGRFLGNRELMSQLEGSRKLVDGETEWGTPAVDFQKTVSLTETGDELVGAYHQEQTYFIAMPSGQLLADASKVNLEFRYAQNLDFNRSLVTVRINGTPIGSKKLTRELANGDKAVFTVPANFRVSGSFSLTVAFDLELDYDACLPPGVETPWAYIDPGSRMQINSRDQPELLFNHYPYPFIRGGQYNQVAVVLPRERDEYTYRTVSNLFSLLGRYAAGNAGEVRFYEDTVEPELLKDRNVIAIGSYLDNEILQAANKELYFQYDESGAGFISNEKMSIDADYGSRIGTLQLIVSPFGGGGQGLLAVTGATPESSYRASLLLAGESSRWRVYGDGVVADKDGNVYAYRFKKEAGSQGESVLEQLLARNDLVRFTAAAVLILLLVLVALIFLVRKHGKKRGSRV